MTLQPGQALALLNGDFIHQQASRLAQSIAAADLADEGVVTAAIETVLAREASAAEVAEGVKLIQDLQNNYGLSRGDAVDLYCLTVLNWNEFVFLD